MRFLTISLVSLITADDNLYAPNYVMTNIILQISSTWTTLYTHTSARSLTSSSSNSPRLSNVLRKVLVTNKLRIACYFPGLYACATMNYNECGDIRWRPVTIIHPIHWRANGEQTRRQRGRIQDPRQKPDQTNISLSPMDIVWFQDSSTPQISCCGFRASSSILATEPQHEPHPILHTSGLSVFHPIVAWTLRNSYPLPASGFPYNI